MSAGAGTQKGASGGVGVMSASGTSLWLEKGAGTIGSRYGGSGHRPGIPPVEPSPWSVLPASCQLLPHWCPETHLPCLHLLGFPDVFLLGL